jgi:hypothetical protein
VTQASLKKKESLQERIKISLKVFQIQIQLPNPIQGLVAKTLRKWEDQIIIDLEDNMTLIKRIVSLQIKRKLSRRKKKNKKRRRKSIRERSQVAPRNLKKIVMRMRKKSQRDTNRKRDQRD